MKFNFFSKVSHFLKKDLNTTLSIGYLALVVVGMLFEVCTYKAFNINIVQYSDISDFLLAPFRDFTILLFVVGTIAFVYALMVFDDWTEEHYPRFHTMMYMGIDKENYKMQFNKNGALHIIFLYVIFAAVLHSQMMERQIKKSTYSTTQVVFKDNHFEPSDTLIYIGKTNGYLFLYHRNTKQTEVVPVSDVLRMAK